MYHGISWCILVYHSISLLTLQEYTSGLVVILLFEFFYSKLHAYITAYGNNV